MSRLAPVYLLAFVPQLLLMAGLVVAFIFALVKRASLGAKASGLAASGLGLLIIAELASAFWSFAGFRIAYNVLDVRQPAFLTSAFALMSKVIFAVGLGLVIAAVFAVRPHRTEAQPHAPRP